MRKLRDDNYNQFDSDLWKEMVEMGWTALTIPEEYNGLNFGYVGLGQVIEEMEASSNQKQLENCTTTKWILSNRV